MNKTLAGVVLLIVGVIGYVALAVLLKGDPDAANVRGSFLFLIAPASALLAVDAVEKTQKETVDRVKRVEAQTNGVLSRSVEEVANHAADKAIRKLDERNSNNG